MDSAHQMKFKQVWDKGNYRRGSTAQRLVNRLIEIIPRDATINDYGCGTGRAEVEISKLRPNQSILMLDIADNALEGGAFVLLNTTFKVVDLSELGNIRKADWGICINVLMTVQPEKLDKILSEMKRTCNNLFVEVYDFSDKRLGYEMTTVKMNKMEWMEKLFEFWQNVIFEQSKEHPQRYIFICKEAK